MWWDGLPPLRIPRWRWLGGWTLTLKSNGEHDLRIQVPRLSYFSIDLVLALRRHTLWSSGSLFARRVTHLLFSCCNARRAQVWSSPSLAEETVFFISSVEDSVLERSAALESHCFGIGFGRLERIYIFMYLYITYIIVLFAIRFLRKSDYCPLFARRVRCSKSSDSIANGWVAP